MFNFSNRLESNSDHWNALLLSLRELTEWVIRKDTELSTLGLGPLRGDAASLQKQLVSVYFTRRIANINLVRNHFFSCKKKQKTKELNEKWI